MLRIDNLSVLLEFFILQPGLNSVRNHTRTSIYTTLFSGEILFLFWPFKWESLKMERQENDTITASK